MQKTHTKETFPGTIEKGSDGYIKYRNEKENKKQVFDPSPVAFETWSTQGRLLHQVSFVTKLIELIIHLGNN